ncbi:CAAD domain-containing protein [Nodosilinea sp. LEGE 06152]|uniref:CAAD domain-containing protein n=1 Tax=Nodosilinea sp. LEGE 06152 TaxID=2777966 RepID=UPI001882CE6A|nr:CAAD domain-containing protein [Nodosilinea sp. LEGE 06152]MBE9155739.1 CAAD domain-containing protein [Nodosilinea sp. LEGE 06152]
MNDYQSDTAFTEPVTPVPDPVIDVDTSESTTDSLGEEATRQVQIVWDKVSGLLGDLPDYVSVFFKRYRRPIVTVGLIIAAIIAVKLVLALLDAINDFPLLAPTFELIGLIYSGWFLYRYLLKASNRQELLGDIAAIRDQVLGKGQV